MRYVIQSQNRITTVLIVKIQATRATISLLVADVSPQQPRWAHREDVFYDDQLDGQQPVGQVALYPSDLLSPGLPVPSAFSRPTAAEAAAGVVRYVLLSYPLLSSPILSYPLLFSPVLCCLSPNKTHN